MNLSPISCSHCLEGLFSSAPHTSMIVILFSVKVPVLSVQMQSAFPIVSQLLIFLTRLLSSIIFLTEYAREIVTASGKPSGIAHTITDIPMMIAFRILERVFSQSPWTSPT